MTRPRNSIAGRPAMLLLVLCLLSACGGSAGASAGYPNDSGTTSNETGAPGGGTSGDSSTSVEGGASNDAGASDGAATFPPGPFTLTVTLSGIDGATGKVTSTSTPTGDAVDCGTACTIARAGGTQVTLQAVPTAGYSFGGWSGACAGLTATCTLTLAQDQAVTAAFTPANLVFVTPGTYTVADVQSHSALPGTATPVQKMFAGADAICRQLGGADDFYAWIASNLQNAATRLPATSRGWVRKDGRPFKDTLVGAAVLYPARLDQNGTSLPPDSLTFSGAKADGSAEDTCSDWSASADASAAAASFTVGRVDEVGTGWSFYTSGNCSSSAEHLLCLGTRYTAAVTEAPPPAGARLAFVSTYDVPIDTGVGALDSRCAADAAGKLPGTYKAFVATSSASAGSRFTFRGGPLYRPDGALLFDADTSLTSASAEPFAPLSILADGTQILGNVFVATGAPDPSMPGGSEACGDWQTTTGSAGIGYVFSTADWFGLGTADCTRTDYSVYCLQE